jgi:hypothetical protein
MDTGNPIFFSLKSVDGAILYYFGVQHSRDPKHPQFAFIKEKWNSFLNLAKASLAIGETKGWKNIPSSEMESIAQGGESLFLAFLANQASVSYVCFEPEIGGEMNSLLKNFSKEQVEYYYFARIAAQWHRLASKPSIEEYVAWNLKRDERVSGWKDFEFSIDHMKEIHMSFFGAALNLNDLDWFQKIANPTREDNPLKGVVCASGEYRDNAIIEGVKNAWLKDKNDVFMVYGSGHAKKYQAEFSKALT